jgi:hypothetical protein
LSRSALGRELLKHAVGVRDARVKLAGCAKEAEGIVMRVAERLVADSHPHDKIRLVPNNLHPIHVLLHADDKSGEAYIDKLVQPAIKQFVSLVELTLAEIKGLCEKSFTGGTVDSSRWSATSSIRLGMEKTNTMKVFEKCESTNNLFVLHASAIALYDQLLEISNASEEKLKALSPTDMFTFSGKLHRDCILPQRLCAFFGVDFETKFKNYVQTILIPSSACGKVITPILVKLLHPRLDEVKRVVCGVLGLTPTLDDNMVEKLKDLF